MPAVKSNNTTYAKLQLSTKQIEMLKQQAIDIINGTNQILVTGGKKRKTKKNKKLKRKRKTYKRKHRNKKRGTKSRKKGTKRKRRRNKRTRKK